MNILYISPMKIDRENLDGVGRKILAQCNAFKEYPEVENVFLASYYEDNRYLVVSEGYEKEIEYVKKSSKQLELLEIYFKLIEMCEELKIDSVYFRVYALSWASNNLFKELHKNGVKIVVEIPTYPFWKEKWMDVKDKFFTGQINVALKRTLTNIVHFLYAHQLHKYIQAIVTFSNISRLWGNLVIGIANGYEFDDWQKCRGLKNPKEKLNLLMVASIRENHGADRVIEGLSIYLKEKHDREVAFHIVGEGEIVPKLKERVAEEKELSENVIFHGFKSGKDLDEMYDIADIGISTIGFHRLGVYFASPLKSKEYFAKGIPVVGTTAEHDILESESKKYYFALPEDDTPLDLSKLCEFYNNLYQQGCTNEDISNSAKRAFEWKKIMYPVYEKLSK